MRWVKSREEEEGEEEDAIFKRGLCKNQEGLCNEEEGLLKDSVRLSLLLCAHEYLSVKTWCRHWSKPYSIFSLN